MTVVTVASVCGSPGATRFLLGLAAAWPDQERRRVVVEADPDGGRLGAELGIGVEPGLMALALAARNPGLTAGDLVERGAAPVGEWFVVPAPPSAEQTTSALVHAAGSLAAIIAADDGSDGPVWLIDGGRLSTRSPALPFARVADHVVVVTAGAFPHLQLVPHRVDALRAAGCAVSVVVVEPTSWPPDGGRRLRGRRRRRGAAPRVVAWRGPRRHAGQRLAPVVASCRGRRGVPGHRLARVERSSS